MLSISRRVIIHGELTNFDRLDQQSQEETTTKAKKGANLKEVKHKASRSPAAFSNCQWQERLLSLDASRWGWEESPWILSEQPHPLRRSTSLPSSPQVSTEPLTAPHCFTINHRKATEKPYWEDKEHGLHSICFLWTHLFQWAIVGRLNAFFRSPCRLKLPAMSLLPKQLFHVDELG